MAEKEYDESVIYDEKLGYFAAKSAEDCVNTLESKSSHYNRTLESFGYWDKLRDMYAAWHGAYNTSIGNSHEITFTGENGEYSELVANHLRNIGKHMLNMVTSVRPAMETKAINTDNKSQVQTKLGNGLLDYYMRASGKNVEERLKLACEYAICLGAGHIKISWNPSAGEITNQDEINEARRRKLVNKKTQIPRPEYEGDVEFSIHTPFDIVMDLTKEDIRHDWKQIRSRKNRYDLIKAYPDLADELMKVQTVAEIPEMSLLFTNDIEDQTDDVLVYEFYHRRSESLPDGRYIMYCNDKTILYDGPLPYRQIPIYSIRPSRILGTSLGYTDMFDLMPLQDAINMLHSTILTNQSAFGVQTILNPSTNNIDAAQISNGLAILNYNPQGGEPKALQLTSTPPEIFNYLQLLVQTEETISGMNSVVRGNPEASLRSGSAIAMIQSNAIQYMSGLQSQYVKLIEGVGLGLLNMLVDFADSPRIADIVGESGKNYVKKFKGDDLRSINRVIVDSANPMSKTIAGRMNMADNLLQYGDITSKQYMNVINTGNLETATDAIVNEQMFIKEENEALMEGDSVFAFYLDAHKEHIMGHRALISDPGVRRNNPELLQLVGEHIKEHIKLLRETDPDLLMTFGEQPLQAASMPGGEAPVDAMVNPPTQPPVEQAVEATGAQPNQVRLPEGMEDIPLTPEANLERIKGE